MTLKKLKAICDRHFGTDIATRSRERQYVDMRAHFVGLAIYCNNISDYSIGKAIDRNHATVINSRKTFEALISYDKYFITEHWVLLTKIKNHIPERKYEIRSYAYKADCSAIRKRFIKARERNDLLRSRLSETKKRHMETKRKLKEAEQKIKELCK